LTYRSLEIEKGIPGYAAVNPNTNTCYISYTSSDFIIVINLDKGTIENKIKVSHPKNIVVNNVTNKIYAASADGVYEINGVNNEFVVINTGSHSSSGTVSVDSVTNTVYTCFDNSNSLIVINALTHSISNDIVVGKTLRGLQLIRVMKKYTQPKIQSTPASGKEYLQTDMITLLKL